MKIRQGFVSNSSSSSFVIAFKKLQPCSHCGKKSLDIVETTEMMRFYGCSDINEVERVGKENIKDYINEFIYGKEKDDVIEAFEKYALEDIWNFAVLRIYHNQNLIVAIDDGVRDGDIVMLHSDND